MSWKADVFQDIIVPSDFVRIKTFPDRNCDIPNLSGLKRFLTDNLFNLSHLSVKYALFTDKLGLGTACATYLLPQSRISERI